MEKSPFPHPIYQTHFYGDVSGPIHTGSGNIAIHYHGRKISIPPLQVLRRHCEQLAELYKEWSGTRYIFEQADMLPLMVSPYNQNDSEPQKLDLITALKSSQRTLLLGGPGSGKSTSLERLGLEYSRDLFENRGDLNLIPIIVPLSRYTGSLRQAVRASLNTAGVLQLQEDSLDIFLLSVRCFITFDGINEVAGAQRDRIIPDIGEFLNTYLNHKFIITGRLQDELWQAIPQGLFEKRLAICPVEAEDAIKYLCAHLGEWLGRFSYGDLSARTRELLQLPLILWMFKEEMLHTKRELDKNSILITEASIRAARCAPQNKSEMYENFIKFVLVREKEKGSLAAKTRLPVKERCLAKLALAMQQHRTLAFRRPNVISNFSSTLKSLREVYVPNELLEEVQLNGILVGVNDLRFVHQTFQEFFAATELAISPPSLMKKYANDPWWIETIIFLAGITDLGSFNKLMRAVLDSNPLLAVRCILEGRVPSAESRGIVQKKLVSMIKSGNWLDRQQAAEFLGLLGDGSVVPMLSRLLDDSAPAVRWQAASSLRNISGPDAEAALIKALQDAEWATRARAAEALGRMKAFSAIPHLRPLLISNMPRERCDASYALVLMKVTEDVEGISELLLDNDPRVSASVALAIEVTNSPDPVDTLRSSIQSENPRVREKAVYLITRLHSVDSIPLLGNLLGDPDSDVVIIAMQSLAELNAVEYIPDVIRLFNNPIPFVRTIAAFSCQLFGSKSIAPNLLPLLRDPDPEVRFASVRTLGVLGVPDEIGTNVVGEIMALLKNPSQKVKLHAVITLGALGTADVLQHLEFAKQDESFEVREAANVSIFKIKMRNRIPSARI